MKNSQGSKHFKISHRGVSGRREGEGEMGGRREVNKGGQGIPQRAHMGGRGSPREAEWGAQATQREPKRRPKGVSRNLTHFGAILRFRIDLKISLYINNFLIQLLTLF